MRVLHVIPSLAASHGGPSKAVRLYARAAQGQGMEVTIATTNDRGNGSRLGSGPQTTQQEDGIEVLHFSLTSLPYKISIDLRRWLRKNVSRFEVVHIHALFSFSSTAAAAAARRSGVPYIVRPLGVLNRWGMENRRALPKRLSLALVERRIVTGAAAMHYTATRERTEAIATLPELEQIRSAIIPVPLEGGSSVGQAFPLASREGAASANRNARPTKDFFARYPEARGKQVILFLSRIDPKKGVDLLLEAFALLAGRCPDAVLAMGGDGDRGFVDRMKALGGGLGLGERVIWTGWLGAEEKGAAFGAASVFVLPSYSENFGIAAAEAMAAGVATILTEEVALADEAKSADAVVVVRAEKDELAKAIERLLHDSVERGRVAAAGRRFAEERFSSARIGMALKELYQSVGRGSAAR